MGYIRHHAIVVTSWDEHAVEKARDAATCFGMTVTPIVDSPINNYATFLVCPDGSKEGWPESDAGDKERDAFIEWLENERYDDGSSSLDWAEVQYGDDNRDQRVLRASS